MKTNGIKVLFFALIGVLFACDKDLICKKGDGNISTKTIALNSFTGVSLDVPGDVTISQGPVQEIVLTGDQNVVDAIDTKVVSGVWNIDFGTKCFKNYDLSIALVIPDLTRVNISGSGNVLVREFNNVDQINSNISGSGNITFKQLNQCESISFNISGSGSVAVMDSSTIDDMEILISGSGEVLSFLSNTQNCNVDISGSGNAQVFVNSLLDINISGSGNVSYKGTPIITQSISGSGNVINAN